MKILSVTYSRKVSDMKYGNEELGLTAEVAEGDSVAEVVQRLQDCVNLRLGLLVAPPNTEIDFVKRIGAVAEKLEKGNVQATSFTKEDVDKALSIINRVRVLKETLYFLGEEYDCGFDWEQYQKDRVLAWRAYFPDSPEAR